MEHTSEDVLEVEAKLFPHSDRNLRKDRAGATDSGGRTDCLHPHDTQEQDSQEYLHFCIVEKYELSSFEPTLNLRQLVISDLSNLLRVRLHRSVQVLAVRAVIAHRHSRTDVFEVRKQTGPLPRIYIANELPSSPFVIIRLVARICSPPYSMLVLRTEGHVPVP